MALSTQEILYKLRTQKHDSQETVAEAINVDRVTYTRYENGTRRPGAREAVCLAHYFGVSVEYLLGLSDEAETEENKKPSAQGEGLKGKVISRLNDLSEAELQRVDDFLSGIQSVHKGQ